MDGIKIFGTLVQTVECYFDSLYEFDCVRRKCKLVRVECYSVSPTYVETVDYLVKAKAAGDIICPQKGFTDAF